MLGALLPVLGELLADHAQGLFSVDDDPLELVLDRVGVVVGFVGGGVVCHGGSLP